MKVWLYCIGALLIQTPVHAAEGPTIPQPRPAANGQCVRYGNLPPVCPFRVYLTPEQRQVIEQMHRQNVEKLKSAQ